MWTFNPTGTGRTGTIQQWVVPASGSYSITAAGARGGLGERLPPGNGAQMSGIFNLTQGQTLSILVGQMGGDGTSGNRAGGGGGGTYVVAAGNAPIIVASGGNGGSWTNHNHPGAHGRIDNNGTTNGGAGHSRSGGGGGLTGNGLSTGGGLSFVNNGTGGVATSPGGFGGFGGGGGCQYEGGGGGGYNGGSGPPSNAYNDPGIGAGSYNSGTSQNNESGVNSGHGFVIIEQAVGLDETLPVPTNVAINGDLLRPTFSADVLLDGRPVYVEFEVTPL